MQVQLEHPEFLWLLVGVVPLLAFAAIRSYAIAPSWARWTSFALRAIGLTCVALALCRPVWRLEKDDEVVVFAVDVSDSIGQDALVDAMRYIAEATADLDSHQRATLLVFGGRPEVLRPMSSEPIVVVDDVATNGAATPAVPVEGAPTVTTAAGPLPLGDAVFHRARKLAIKARIQAIERDLTAPDAAANLATERGRLAMVEAFESGLLTGETDVREALRLARSVMPEDARRRVILFSDGNWTRSDPARELSYLARSGVTVDTRVMQLVEPNEVIAQRLTAPGQVRVREPVELELRVDSATAGPVEMEVFRNGFRLSSQTVELDAGENLIRVPKQELDEGFHEFMVRIHAPDDPRPENNIARTVVVVEGRPRVLLIEGDERDARYLESALQDEDIMVEVRPAIGFPKDLNDLLSYDVLILSDVAATDLHSSQLGLVKRYVKDFGGGLVMIGGERSFGLGGYYRTPVEDALPVRMPIKKTIEKPSFALVLVLDRSGSMAGEKLALAKEAGIASAELLKSKDRLGVVVFDEQADWVVELQPADNRDQIVGQIGRIVEGGGTYIYAGLYYAYQALSECDAKLKHCIVLSDGHTTGSREEHIDIVYRMAAEQITVSTVGIGDADQALMSAMAEAGNGEAYFTSDFGSVPQIFTKETLRASKSMLVEEPFVPRQTGVEDQMLRGVELADAPILLGYVSTTPKERARVLLVSDYGDPILASWSYGLGQSVAFTSDAKNRWAADWIGWSQFGKFWSQIVRGVMSRGTTDVLQQQADLRVERGRATVRIDSRDREGRFVDAVEPEMAIVDPNGAARPIPSTHVAPGLYEAEFDIQDYGDYTRLRVESKLEGRTVALRRYALIESYPPEYRAAAADPGFLGEVANTSGGRREPAVDAAFTFDGPLARGLVDLWRILVLIAALLLPIDIALRRLA